MIFDIGFSPWWWDYPYYGSGYGYPYDYGYNYGYGYGSTYDYGPLGVELKNNLKQAWWRANVYEREDMEGIDAAILMNKLTWRYSGHEDTFVDESMYDDFPGSPRLAGTHIDLWQSLSKHSTYTFDPDFFPILQIWFIGFIFIQIEIWFSDCGNDDPFWDEFFWDDPFPEMTCVDVYYAVLRIAVLFIFTCFVERFFEQGGALANIRINVGEPPGFGGGFGIAGGNPINGSSFILDNSDRAFHLYNKLIEPLRFESLF